MPNDTDQATAIERTEQCKDGFASFADGSAPELSRSVNAIGSADAIERANEAAHNFNLYVTGGSLRGTEEAELASAFVAFAQQAPEGWVLVPRVPTREMNAAGREAHDDTEPWGNMAEVWSAMLDASPSVGEGV